MWDYLLHMALGHRCLQQISAGIGRRGQNISVYAVTSTSTLSSIDSQGTTAPPDPFLLLSPPATESWEKGVASFAERVQSGENQTGILISPWLLVHFDHDHSHLSLALFTLLVLLVHSSFRPIISYRESSFLLALP